MHTLCLIIYAHYFSIDATVVGIVNVNIYIYMLIYQNTKTVNDDMRLCRSGFKNIIFKIFSHLIQENVNSATPV